MYLPEKSSIYLYTSHSTIAIYDNKCDNPGLGYQIHVNTGSVANDMGRTLLTVFNLILYTI
jgi:hypothetical protein